MTKHVMKGAADSEPVIEWSMEVDDDGHVDIMANGVLVMFVNDDGVLVRCNIGPIDGLTLNDRGEIKDAYND